VGASRGGRRHRELCCSRERGTSGLLSSSDLNLAPHRNISPAGSRHRRNDRGIFGAITLHDTDSTRGTATETSACLHDEGNGALRRTLIGEEEAGVSADDANECKAGEVQRFSRKRRAYEDVRLPASESIENSVCGADWSRHISIESIDAKFGEACPCFSFKFFGPATKRSNPRTVAGGATGQRFGGDAAAMAAQQ
jgi:hypothetical protein